MQRTKLPNPISQNNISYPIQDEPLVFSKAVFDLFLKEGKFPSLMALYSFYYYTAKWQKTDYPKATTEYAAEALGWGRGKLIATKRHLKELGLIEDQIYKDVNGRVIGHYIKINFIFTTLRVQPRVVKLEGNALNPNSIYNTPTSNNKNKIPPSIEQVTAYCKERKNKVDPQNFIDHYSSNGWMVGKTKMKDWQAAVRTWEKNSYTTQTKEKDASLKYKPKFIIDDGIKYILSEDGYYRHCRTGQIYIE